MLKFLKPKIEIVELKNGKFAVRKTFFGEQTFYDPSGYYKNWRQTNDSFFKDCQFKKLEKAQEIYHRVTSSIVVRVVFP